MRWWHRRETTRERYQRLAAILRKPSVKEPWPKRDVPGPNTAEFF